jgi:hypothetical protein
MPDEPNAPDYTEQQPGETDLQFAWFRSFLEMGPGRSVRAAHRAFTGKEAPKGPSRPQNLPGAWKRAADKWQWHTRAGYYDLAQSDRRLSQYQTRRRNLNERALDYVEKQFDRAKILDSWSNIVMRSPRYSKPVETEDGVVMMQPADWKFGDGIRASTASDTSLKRGVDVLQILDQFEARDRATETARLFTPADPAATPTQERAALNAKLSEVGHAALYEALAGVPGGFEKLLAVADRQRALNGLAKPFDPSAEQTEKHNRDFSHWPPELLKFLESAYKEHGDGSSDPQPTPPSNDPDAEV